MWYLCGLVALSVGLWQPAVQANTDNYCKPGQTCWPCGQDFQQFKASLDGDLLQFIDKDYDEASYIKNWEFSTKPAYVLQANNSNDIQKAIQFATRFGIQVSIVSSAHDFAGRNTGLGSLQISVKRMKRLIVNPTDAGSSTGASVRAETGVNMGEIYRAVDPYDLMAVGGSSHTVAVGGWFLGGGHSPLSRSLGLGVDQVISFRVVMVDGRQGTVTLAGIHYDGDAGVAPNTGDLFWALRGGGGSTFAVVTEFYFQVHRQPLGGFTIINANYPWYHPIFGPTGEQTMDVLHNFFASRAPRELGGFIMVNNIYVDLRPDVEYVSNGSITVSLVYAGPRVAAERAARPLLRWHPEWRNSDSISEHPTFWDYSQHIVDDYAGYTYLANRLVQPEDFISQPNELSPLTDVFKTYFDRNAIYPIEKGIGCTYATLGHQTSVPEDEDTAVHPAFRTALASLSCATVVTEPDSRDTARENMEEFMEELIEVGTGMYYNEPYIYAENWQDEYWGENYARLAQIKYKYDPNRFFYCNKCVGSDRVYTPPTGFKGKDDESEEKFEYGARSTRLLQEPRPPFIKPGMKTGYRYGGYTSF